MTSPGRFYATTPIYYVNDKPHIGHAYCTVLTDAMVRFQQLLGAQTYFLTGTDEHGQKVERAANKRGIAPQAHCDDLHRAFRDLWPDLQIGNDDFIRTTEPRHVKVVQALLQKLYDKGEIYAQDYEGWYSTAAERFWTEKDLVDGKCPDTGQPVERITERNYFFRMSKYADALRAHIEANPKFIRPPHRANEVLGFLNKGLEDLCISRPKSRLAWGIEVPFDRDYVVYVWFDALLNYISALGGPDDAELFERWWPHVHHFIGKDILTTHSVYWTTMLLALELPLPRSIVATGWWLQQDTKMSKTLGNVVSPLGMRELYGTDVLRYFLMRDMVIGLDANFSEEALVRRNNSDLANDLGNLARRAAGLLGRYFDGRVPERGEDTADEREISERFRRLGLELPGLVRDLKLHAAIEEAMQVVRRLNKYMTDTAPFRTVKTDPAVAARSLYTVLEGLRHVAWMLYPVMPTKMMELLAGIGAPAEPGTLGELRWGELAVGAEVTLREALFPRADLPAPPVEAVAPAEPLQPKVAAPKAAEPQGGPAGVISYEDVMRVELRVALVVEAERVVGASKLLRLQVDLGGERRQIVAGIAKHLAPEDMVGRQVVVVANLAPRSIFKLESQGMLLAAERADGGLELIGPGGEVPPGTRVS